MARLSDIIAHLDCDIKKMSYYEVCSVINSCDKEDQTSFEARAEIIGMSFVEDTGYKEWGCYYGPETTWAKKDTGDIVYMPDIADIIPKQIKYWTKRAAETNNPLLKMRYCGLVWEFGKKITGQEPSFKDIKLQFIISSIETVEQDLAGYSVSGITYSKRAIEKSISIKNQELTEKAISAMIAYSEKYAKDNLSGIWGRPFKIMVDHLKEFSSFENQMVQSMVDRFDRLEALCIAEGRKADAYVYTLKDAAELLSDYYKKKQQADKIVEYLKRYHSCLALLFNIKGAMWSQGMILNLQAIFRKYNLNKFANWLYLEIQAFGSKILNEMSPTQISVSIKNEQIDEYFAPLLEGTDEEIIDKYVVEYIPVLEIEKKEQQMEAQKSPLLNMVRTVAYDYTGMPISNIGVGKNAETQKLYYGMYRRMIISSAFIQMHIKRMEDKGTYTYDKVLDLFNDSFFILEPQRPIFEKGLKAYFDKDYIIACHLLIPLFESAIRTLAALTGHEVLRPNANPEEGNEYVSLEGLLTSLTDVDNMPEDLIVYFKSLFTDKYGWNTRNLMCHGLLNANVFNNTLADRIVHAFLLLSQIRLIPITNDSTESTEEAK